MPLEPSLVPQQLPSLSLLLTRQFFAELYLRSFIFFSAYLIKCTRLYSYVHVMYGILFYFAQFEPPALARPPDAQWPAFLNQLYQPRGPDAAPVAWPAPSLPLLPPPAAHSGTCVGSALAAPHANNAASAAAVPTSSVRTTKTFASILCKFTPLLQ